MRQPVEGLRRVAGYSRPEAVQCAKPTTLSKAIINHPYFGGFCTVYGTFGNGLLLQSFARLTWIHHPQLSTTKEGYEIDHVVGILYTHKELATNWGYFIMGSQFNRFQTFPNRILRGGQTVWVCLCRRCIINTCIFLLLSERSSAAFWQISMPPRSMNKQR